MALFFVSEKWAFFNPTVTGAPFLALVPHFLSFYDALSYPHICFAFQLCLWELISGLLKSKTNYLLTWKSIKTQKLLIRLTSRLRYLYIFFRNYENIRKTGIRQSIFYSNLAKNLNPRQLRGCHETSMIDIQNNNWKQSGTIAIVRKYFEILFILRGCQ